MSNDFHLLLEIHTSWMLQVFGSKTMANINNAHHRLCRYALIQLVVCAICKHPELSSALL
jgi:hypothetical protein